MTFRPVFFTEPFPYLQIIVTNEILIPNNILIYILLKMRLRYKTVTVMSGQKTPLKGFFEMVTCSPDPLPPQ